MIKNKLKNRGLVIPGTYDLTFKAIMQNGKCFNYLVEILNICTKIPENDLKENLIIRNSELPIENVNKKRKVTDLVLDIKNNIINLEMNNNYYYGLLERNDIYLNTLRSLNVKEKYSSLKKVIQINFDNFYLYDERTVIKFVIMDEERHIKETDNFEKYHINLKRINEKYYNNEELSRLEKLLLLLTLDKVVDLERVAKGDEVMENVKDTLIELSQDEAMILCYDEDEYKEEVRKMVTETEKIKARKEGLEAGHEEGLKEGHKEGHKEGLREGREEGLEQGKRISLINTARKMLEKGFSYEEISDITSLTIDEIKRVKEK